MTRKYNIKTDEKGRQIFRCVIEWTDESGEKHLIASDDVEESETTLGLLSGNINLADLES